MLIALLCLVLASCYGMGDIAGNEDASISPDADPTPAPVAATKSAPRLTPSSSPAIEPTPQDVLPELSYLSFGHAAEVFANPDAFTGKEYGSPFMIVSEQQQMNASSIYYAQGYISGGAAQTYTVLDFGTGDVLGLVPGEVVYVRGVIEGGGTMVSDTGESVDVLWITVSEVEKDVTGADISAQTRKVSLAEGACSAASSTLTMEVLSLDFSEDALMLSTRTSDTAVEQFETYYIDIVVHQDGCFAWYAACNFWINSGSAGYDNIPLPPMDSTKDMTIEFVPFDASGKLLYEPLVIDVPVSEP